MRELHDTAMMMQSQHSDEQIAELRKEFAATADENKELRQDNEKLRHFILHSIIERNAKGQWFDLMKVRLMVLPPDGTTDH